MRPNRARAPQPTAEGTVHMRPLHNGKTLGITAALLVLLAAAGCSANHSTSNNSVPPGPNGQPIPNGVPGLNGPDSSRTGFQPEVHASEEPNSTFAIDIDTASYNYAR